MKPHPRIRKTIKWGGAAVTLLLLVAWIGSLGAQVCWVSAKGSVIGVAGERVYGMLSNGTMPPWQTGFVARSWPPPMHAWGLVPMKYEGVAWRLEIPLLIPCLAIGFATIAAWRLDAFVRRCERIGRCPSCNYDRAGIAAGAKCPECGAMPVNS